tara:strand:- start:1430 stop:2422 length:993 start_codon:yes stop_codon:yes gene_type:complete
MNKIHSEEIVLKRPSILIPINDVIADDEGSCCLHVIKSIPLICKNLKLKLSDHLLLGGEHNQKFSIGFNSPSNLTYEATTTEEKTQVVLSDPKFGMFSLFKYHVNKGYMNKELKKSNKIFCSHIFSLVFALPIIIYISQWVLYVSLLNYEFRNFDGNLCPNNSPIELKLMMFGIGLIYFVRSFFIWDNLTSVIGLNKSNRADHITAILDTLQEFLFSFIVYIANLWIIFVEKDLQNMILNSLAMEFLMRLDNEFEEMYFEYLPGSAQDIYDNIFVDYNQNVKYIRNRQNKSMCFKYSSYILTIPYKILIFLLFCFPLICLIVTIYGPICK